MYSSSLYAELREHTGLDPGWRGVGGLRLATTAERVEELHRQVERGDHVRAGRCRCSRRPRRPSCCRCSTSTTCSPPAGCPATATCDPSALARALAAGARALGVAVRHPDPGDRDRGGRRPGARPSHTDRGRIATEVVVNAAGAAAGHVGRPGRCERPGRADQAPVRGERAAARRRGRSPTSRPCATPTTSSTSAARATGLLVGGYLRTPAGVLADGRTAAAGRPAPPLRAGPGRLRRVVGGGRAAGCRPCARSRSRGSCTGPRRSPRTASSSSARPRSRGLWVAAGFCVHGLAAAGGVGKVMAEWIVDGRPEYDVAAHGHPPLRRARGQPLVGDDQGPATPTPATTTSSTRARSGPAARPLRRSATWPRLSALDAQLGEKAGWERVNWFGGNDRGGDEAAAPDRLGRSASGHRPSRRRCGPPPRRPACSTSRRSPSSTCAGPDAVTFLQRMCANDVDRPVGHASSTPSCSTSGPASRPT